MDNFLSQVSTDMEVMQIRKAARLYSMIYKEFRADGLSRSEAMELTRIAISVAQGQ